LLVLDLLTKKIQTNRRERPITVDWWKLKENESEELIRKTAEKLVEQSEVRGFTWKKTYRKILKPAKDTLGESRIVKYLEKESWWWNAEVQNAIAKEMETIRNGGRQGKLQSA
jgi:hypothetical protein